MAEDTHQRSRAAGDGDLTRREHSLPQAAAREEMARRMEDVARVQVRPIASPVPIGFLGLAVATTMVAAMNLGWIPAGQGDVVAFALLAFVVPAQAVSSVFGILARDGVFATGMAVLTGTWATFGLVILTSPPGSTSDALGVLLIVSAVAMACAAIGASLSKLVPAVVLAGASLRFLTAAVYQLTGSSAWEAVTGWVGIVLAVVAVYAAFAALLEGAQKRTVLPMGRRQEGRRAVEGGLSEQLVDLTHEPGVRTQL
jgi:succinate-acetate transporter protein